MKKISITSENAYLIDQHLAQLQVGCTERTLSYRDIETASNIAESMLDELLSKKHRQNVCAVVKPVYEKFSPEYRGVPEHTACHIRRGRKDWYITSMLRTKADRSGSSKIEIIKESLCNKHDYIVGFVTKNLTCDS